ncbi:MAG TPA: GNAT family N-acetyltransferase [Aliidongia sp.]|uniref:GNAT family N-acetyltransferase n=1 Tax=Aliidongia sp. TaxID=1914230 RepID=UPI002DDD4FD0|nr:GNAT family N-acetyltransferase [Aliidongia sp.]HEV2678307.1 GNAT family N-acetyltransferase [Aliidongia sp.]
MSSPSTMSIAPARFPGDADAVRGLFAEYVESLGIDLSFQDVNAELAGLPGKYAAPGGTILLARDAARHPVACVALRPLAQAGQCEMKRLYVRPAARGHDLGRRLAQAIISAARDAGYARLLLDTLAPMRSAQKLYAALGFREIAPYYENPVPGTMYMALDL